MTGAVERYFASGKTKTIYEKYFRNGYLFRLIPIMTNLIKTSIQFNIEMFRKTCEILSFTLRMFGISSSRANASDDDEQRIKKCKLSYNHRHYRAVRACNETLHTNYVRRFLF